jgi:hypothetical protein
MKYRTDRRSGLALESPLAFYPRFLAETVSKQARWLWLWGRNYGLYRRIRYGAKRHEYMDDALTPVLDDEIATHEMFNTDEAKAFVAREKHMAEVRAGAA